MPTTPAETKKTRKKYTPLERRLRKLGSGGAGGDLRNDTVPSAQLPIVNAYFSTPPSSSRSRNMVPLPNGNASSTSSSSSSDSNFSSDLSDSLYSSGSECIYTDGSDSDDDSDNGEDWTDPFRLATEGYRFVHMGNFGKLVHRTIPCAECQERRFTNVLDTINSKKKPGKKALRENIKSLRKTPMMHLLSEKHNGFAYRTSPQRSASRTKASSCTAIYARSRRDTAPATTCRSSSVARRSGDASVSSES